MGPPRRRQALDGDGRGPTPPRWAGPAGWLGTLGFGDRFGPEAFFGRGPKVGRGDVRDAILVLLSEQPMHGYQVIQELTERSGGMWCPAASGSVYPTLQQLEDEDLVDADETEGKRVFRLTPAGEQAVAARGDRPAPWEREGAEGPLMELFNTALTMRSAVLQIAQTRIRPSGERREGHPHADAQGPVQAPGRGRADGELTLAGRPSMFPAAPLGTIRNGTGLTETDHRRKEM